MIEDNKPKETKLSETWDDYPCDACKKERCELHCLAELHGVAAVVLADLERDQEEIWKISRGR